MVPFRPPRIPGRQLQGEVAATDCFIEQGRGASVRDPEARFQG
jgi:hypothetical protein